MILGVISIVIGAVIFITALIKDVSTVNHQIVQYLGFIWASLFVIGGFLMITIKKSIEGFSNRETYLNNPGENTQWKCPKCNNENPNSTYQCKNCGYKIA
jgi:hypothetical protein